MKLSEKLIALRKEKGWSQEDFAEKLDVSRQAISRWENGSALPDAQNLLGISKLFHVSADYLLNDDYEKEAFISTPESEGEETVPVTPQKNRFHRFLIPIAVLLIIALTASVTMIAARIAYGKTSSTPEHTTLNSVKENALAPTCTSEGSYDEVVYCTACGEEVLRTTIRVAKLSHTFSDSVKMNEIAPTCIEKGSYDEVVCCTVCDTELLRTRRSTETVDHQYQNRKCTVCGKAKPSEGLSFMSGGDGTCIVDLGNCTDAEIVIPESSPSGDKVTHIKANAFSGRNQVKSIQIPETVIFVGEGAFEDCKNLETVNLPKGITGICSYTFSGCEKLKEITIPAGVTFIGEEAFAECVSLKSIVIPANVTKIGKYAFRNFSGGKGTIEFEIYSGWEVYYDLEKVGNEVDFTNGSATPFEYLTLRFPECVWKRN
ncbi:MAG: helix-turn-helix domain-containing protein [Ruminococcaceae bacterium]|nr:helix-turn-helix domain-containing protein [Oscillospiraceae bacterium]